MASLFSTTSQIAAINTRARSGVITLPLTTTSLYRQIMIKDLYGTFPLSTLTISTQSGDFFEDGTTSRILCNAYEFQALYAGSTTRWHTVAGTQWTSMYVSSLRVDSLQLGSGDGWADFGPLRATAISSLQILTGYLQATSISTVGLSTGTLTACNISAAIISTNYGFFSSISAGTHYGQHIGDASLLTNIPNNGAVLTLSNSLVTTSNNLTTVSNSGVTNATNIGTVSNSLVTTSNNLTTVSNSGVTNTGNITTVSNAGVTNATNIGTVTTNLTTVSNAGVTNATNIGTVSNSVVTNMGYLTTVSNSGVTNTTNIGTVSNSVVTNMGYLTTVSNSGVTNTTNITTVSNSGVTNTTNITTVSNTVAAGRFTGISTNTISTNLIIAGYVSSPQGYISSLIVDSLAFGVSNAYITMGDIITTSVSTVQILTSSLITNNLQVGTVSSLSYIAFPGLQQGYTQTVIAEQATGTGTQELLIFKGSTNTDRIRMQTTGTIVFEPGVSARTFPATGSNVTPAMIITTGSNVGIGIAAPGVSLDVAGAGRFTALSVNTISTNSISTNTGFFNTLSANTIYGQHYGDAANLINIPNNGAVLTVSNSVVTNMGYLTTVSNSGVTNTTNIGTVSNSVVTNMGYLTTVSNTVVTNTGNITTISNSGVTNATNIGTVTTNLTTVSNAGVTNATNIGTVTTNLTTVSNAGVTNATNIGTVTTNLTTVSNAGVTNATNIGTVTTNLTTVSNSGVTNATNIGTVSNSVVTNMGYLTTVSNSGVTNTTNIGTVSNSVVTNMGYLTTVSNTGVTNATNIGTVSNSVVTNMGYLTTVSNSGVTNTTNITTVSNTVAAGRFTGISTNTISTNLIIAGNVSSPQGYISSLTVDSLSFGFSNSYMSMGDIITTSVSSIQIFTSSLITTNLQVGNVSSLSYIAFPGLQQGYTQTVIAEQATATGIQELLIFRGSTNTDRIRMQTTGPIVFEPGVSARTFPATGSNATPAMIITTGSNVGIGVAAPGVSLDVAGAGRFTALSVNTISTNSISTNTGFFNTLSANTIYGQHYGDAANLINIPNNGAVLTVSNSVVTNMGYLTSVSNTVVTNTGNITTVSNSGVTNATNIGTVSNSGVTNATNIGTVSNSVVTNMGYLTSVSNTVVTNTGNITTVSNSGVTNATNIGTVSNSVVTNMGYLTSVSNTVVTNTGNITTISNSGVTNATNIGTVSNTVAAGRFANVSTNTISTNLIVAAYVSSTQAYISSLTVDFLAIGSNYGYVNMGDIIATSLSSIAIESQTLTTSNLKVGIVSSLSYIAFPGLQQGYAQSVIAEQSTGTGIQELLVFRGSSASDRIRMQTTGSIVFEPGVGARVFPATPSNATPAMIITTGSNVGIGIAAPTVSLDVAGAGRFTAVSTNTISTNQINSSNISNVTNQYFQYGGNITGSIGGTGGQQGFLNITYPAAGAGHTNDGVLYLWGGNANGNRYINLDSTNIGITVPKGYGNIWLDANTINTGTFDMYSNIICNVSNLNFITGGSISNVNATRTASLSTNTISTNQINSSNISNAGNFSNSGSAIFFSNGTTAASPSTTNAYPYASFTINSASTNTLTPVTPLLLMTGGYGGSIAGGLTQSVGPVLTLGTIDTGGGGGTKEGYRLTGSNSAFYGNVNMQGNNISNVGEYLRFSTGSYMYSAMQGGFTNAFLDIVGTGGDGQLRLINGTSEIALRANSDLGIIPASGYSIVLNGPITANYNLNMNNSNISNVNTIRTTAVSTNTISTNSITASNATINSGSVNINPVGANYALYVNSPTLGTTAGNVVNKAEFVNSNTNLSYLRINEVREANGSDWYSVYTRIQQYTDVTPQGYIQFNGVNNPNGTSLGTASYSNVLVVKNSARVGINTWSPRLALDVNGAVAVNGYLDLSGNNISNVNTLSTNTIRAGTVYGSFIGDGSGLTGISGSGGVTNILSTNQFFVSSISTATIQTSNIRVGTLSTNSFVSYPGLAKQYSQSILAEQETGTGLQEMLIFRGSSASDRIRLQTTGYIVFETGVGARVYPTITSNVTPSWMIDINGCVGVGIIPSGTATKLDVAGQGRFQNLSTTSIQAGSINLSVAFV